METMRKLLIYNDMARISDGGRRGSRRLLTFNAYAPVRQSLLI